MKTRQDFVELEMWCRVAHSVAPKWSPYRLLFKVGAWYARRMHRALR